MGLFFFIFSLDGTHTVYAYSTNSKKSYPVLQIKKPSKQTVSVTSDNSIVSSLDSVADNEEEEYESSSSQSLFLDSDYYLAKLSLGAKNYIFNKNETETKVDYLLEEKVSQQTTTSQ
jgi:hypothetical protein